MKELTKRQQEVLLFIHEYTAGHSFPPTVREVAGHFGISVKGAHDHISALKKKNYLTQRGKRSRTLEVLMENIADDNLLETPPAMQKIAILGTVAAGTPLMAVENYESTIWLPMMFFRSGQEYFALRVKGDSMCDAGILDGDLAVVERCEQASSGEIIVAVLDDAITLKRFFREAARIRLQAENSAYNPIFCQDVRIVGRLATIVRNY
ncbi:MAG: transcriptional repressor LexA [Spirochaetaceae bacterium]|jgi:repressor LexA|nr:transcriptional repressor LexA [Spirochaetaceae bacterium]